MYKNNKMNRTKCVYAKLYMCVYKRELVCSVCVCDVCTFMHVRVRVYPFFFFSHEFFFACVHAYVFACLRRGILTTCTAHT